MEGLFESLLVFSKRLKNVGETISTADREAIELSVRQFKTVAEQPVLTDFFKRTVRVAETSLSDGTISARVLSAEGNAIPMTARVMGNILQSGDLVRVATLIDPSIEIAATTAEAFSKMASNTPMGVASQLLENVTEMRHLVDEMRVPFRRMVSDAREFEASVKAGGSTMVANYEKLLSVMRSSGGRVGTIAVTFVGGLTAYELLKKHARNASGCYKIQSVGGKTHKCKVVQYSVGKESETACGSVDSVRSDKSDWNLKANASCLKACDVSYLNHSSLDGYNSTTYQCFNLDIWDAMGDVIKGVVDPLEKIFDPNIWIKSGAAVIGIAGAIFAVRSIYRGVAEKRRRSWAFVDGQRSSKYQHQY